METENRPAGKVVVNKASSGVLSYNYLQEALTGKQFFEQHYWFPIPLDEITKSGGLLRQNDNY
jgi:hypothetical protein